MAFSPRTQVIGPKNQILGLRDQFFGPRNWVFSPRNQVFGPTNQVFRPKNKVFGLRNRFLDMEITFLVKDIAARRVRDSRLVWKVGGDTAAHSIRLSNGLSKLLLCGKLHLILCWTYYRFPRNSN